MNQIKIIIVVLSSVLVFTSFFMPWVSVDSSLKGVVMKILSSKKESSLMQISGYQVPILANREDSRLMIEIIKLFNPGITDADKKSWIIWGVPILAVVLALIFTGFHANQWFNLVLAVIGISVFAGGAYQLTTTDLNKIVMKITILQGVWLTLWGYLAMGLIGLVGFLQRLKK